MSYERFRESPWVDRRCPRCRRTRRFTPTGKFRVNANGRRIDVWLLYDCTRCGRTWKQEIVRRASPERIGAELYESFLRNDPETADRYARS